MWIWAATTFLIIFLNILALSVADFNPLQGTCSILNSPSLLLFRFTVYTSLYGGSLAVVLSCAFALLLQGLYHGCTHRAFLYPILLLYTAGYGPVLVLLTYKHYGWVLQTQIEMVLTMGPELQAGFNPLLAIAWSRELRRAAFSLVRGRGCSKEGKSRVV